MSVVLKPMEQHTFQLGLCVHLPEGTCGILRERSSAGVNGLVVLSGLIDSDYRRMLWCTVQNMSITDSFSIHKGRKYVQLLVVPFCKPQVESISSVDWEFTKRGAFGSTDV